MKITAKNKKKEAMLQYSSRHVKMRLAIWWIRRQVSACDCGCNVSSRPGQVKFYYAKRQVAIAWEPLSKKKNID